MALAIFDLDNTLIAGDSDHAWGQFLVEKGIVDEDLYKKANDQFLQDYLNGELDMDAYLAFALKPLAQHSIEQLHAWRELFVEEKIRPLLLAAAQETINRHRAQGDYIMIISATNRFVTEPIAALFEVDHLIATDPEMSDGKYTGRVSGTPSFQHGKVVRLEAWLKETGQSLAGAWFYSDSHNDLPLLAMVENPVAVDPDDTLRAHAEARDWRVVSFRE